MNHLGLYFLCAYVGLFTVGGGLAALPILHESFVDGGLLTTTEFYDMFAVSQSTPGPIGINLATFIGHKTLSYSGALAATAGMVTPSLIIIYLIATFVKSFDKNPYVRRAMRGFRSTAVGLIATAAYFIIIQSVINIKLVQDTGITTKDVTTIFLFILIGGLYLRFKLHPIACALLGAACGILLL